jgi:hypothetical protein
LERGRGYTVVYEEEEAIEYFRKRKRIYCSLGRGRGYCSLGRGSVV